MMPRVFIFDVYGTLLEVGPHPAGADETWAGLWWGLLKTGPRLSRLDFAIACNRIVAQRHERSRSRGIAHPEISWPSVVAEAVPELRLLSPAEIDRFATGFMKLSRTVRLAPEAAAFLSWLQEHRVLIGVASNAQKYTLQELREQLAEHKLGLSIFEPELCFWSFQHGFSKPDPHVFQILSTRLEQRGISAPEVILVGDRVDNDIEPARGYGWQTWHFQPALGFNWSALREWLVSGKLQSSPNRHT